MSPYETTQEIQPWTQRERESPLFTFAWTKPLSLQWLHCVWQVEQRPARTVLAVGKLNNAEG